MAEYIEREAVMQKFADHVRRSNNSDFAPAPTWNQAVQIVEDFPAADVRPVKWIPVTERLPEENGRYLVRYKRDIGLDYIEVHDDEVRIMRFFVDDGWRYPFLCQPELRKAEHQTVTHWMELPILPAEDNENG